MNEFMKCAGDAIAESGHILESTQVTLYENWDNDTCYFLVRPNILLPCVKLVCLAKIGNFVQILLGV